MNVTRDTLEALAAQSWEHFIESKDPTRPWSLVCKNGEEIAEAHIAKIQSILEANFEDEESVRRLTGGKMGFDDLLDASQEFHLKLKQYIKEWLARRT